MRRVSSTFSLAALALLCFCLVAQAGTAGGGLDRAFGVRGFGGGELGPHHVTTSFGAVAEQPDGSLLVTRDETRRRYLADGTLDPGFPPQKVEPSPLEVTLPDGRRLVRGKASGTIARLNPDGTPDPSFHGGESEPTASYFPRYFVPLPSGQILVAGEANRLVGKSGLEYRTGVSRLNADGTLDRSFGDAGLVFVPTDATGYLLDLVGEPDGGGILIGYGGAVRLTPAGALDPSFGSGGVAAVPGGSTVSVNLLPGGGFAIAGTVRDGSTPAADLFVAQFGASGQLDTSFAAGKGIAVADLGGTDTAGAVRWEDDGSVLVGGAATARNPACEAVESCVEQPVLVRFGAAGVLDPALGGDGVVRLDPLAGPAGRFGTGGVAAISPRGAGGYFLGGSAAPERTTAFLAAIGADGALDPAFGSAGIVRETRSVPSSEGSGPVVVAADGTILVGGSTTAGYGKPAAVFHYTRDGKLDPAYGGEPGFARLSGIDRVLDIAVARSGAAIVLGSGGELTRVTADGRIDPGFGSGLPVRFERPKDAFNSIALLPDDRVLVAGTANWHGDRSRMLVARFLPDGRLDRSFGRGGFAAVGCARRGRCAVNQIVAQPDGRILLAGRIQKSGAKAQYMQKPSRLAVARLRADGRPDRSFSGDGVVNLRLGYHATAREIAWSRRGILVAGRVGARSGERETVLLRLRFGGSLDRGFGRGGIVRRPEPSETVALLSTPRRIFVVFEEGPRAVLGFDPAGHLDYSLPSRRLRRGSKWSIYPEAALQGRKPILVWSMFKGPNPTSPSQIELARLNG
ncbi:MAG TPA: hypothetical protein VFB52_10130 [Solirubrobacterales bacterium]|nr:hypothetical protein [Solirubrobacterales bacterium]